MFEPVDGLCVLCPTGRAGRPRHSYSYIGFMLAIAVSYCWPAVRQRRIVGPVVRRAAVPVRSGWS